MNHLQVNTTLIITLLVSILIFIFPQVSFAAGAGDLPLINLTTHWVGYASLAIFVFAYVLVILEDKIHMRKSKPVMLAAGIIWAMVATIYAQQPDDALLALD